MRSLAYRYRGHRRDHPVRGHRPRGLDADRYRGNSDRSPTGNPAGWLAGIATFGLIILGATFKLPE
jgi:hypothetical protein